MLDSQRHLFDIPSEVVYLNTAYMSPLLNSVVKAIDRGVRSKSKPWEIKIDDFYNIYEIIKMGVIINLDICPRNWA